MKTSLLKLATAVSLGCVIAAPAFASDNRQFQITPAVGYNFFDNDRNYDDSEFYGIGLGYGITPKFSIEAWYTDGDADINNSSFDVDITTYRLDALYDLPHLGAWTPYIVGGIGRAEFDEGGPNGSDLDETQVNLGLGLKRSLTKNFSLRADVRALDNIDQGSDTDDFGTDFAFQLAVTYGFGKVLSHAAAPAPVAAAPAPAPKKRRIDSDGDGVLDNADACPNTPAGVKVNSRGCPLDTDRDGVYDYLDKCPGTAAGLKVDNVGCPIKLTSTVDIQLNVNFDTNKAIVKPEYFSEIKRVADFMKQYENTRVEVQGHTDSRGSNAYNKALSQRRADAVAAVLVRQHGVDPRHVTARGYGEESPTASNDNEQGRAANRRVVGSVSAQVERLERR